MEIQTGKTTGDSEQNKSDNLRKSATNDIKSRDRPKRDSGSTDAQYYQTLFLPMME